MKLIVGLGNPGASYRATRHNAGAMAVQKLAKKEKFVFKSSRSFKSHIAQGKIAGTDVCFALPQTFMNLSGEAVAALARKRRIAFCDILVVYDDANLLLGEVKVKASGSDGGHHGLASVIEKLESRDIPRLRIGIGSKELKGELTDYVLSVFDKAELGIFEKALDTATAAIRSWVTQGIDKCMNNFNTKTKC